MGAVAGVVNALFHGVWGYFGAVAVLVAGFLGVDRVARRMPEYSLARGLVSFLTGYILSWFSFYAAFIQ